MQPRSKSTSRAVARLILAGYTATQVAETSGLSRSQTSHVLNGRAPWSMKVEAALLELTENRELVADVRQLASESRDELLVREEAS